MYNPQTSASVPPLPTTISPGMAYVPFQQWEEIYSADDAYTAGTLFPSLDLPFKGESHNE